jgi:hypothetical protein
MPGKVSHLALTIQSSDHLGISIPHGFSRTMATKQLMVYII